MNIYDASVQKPFIAQRSHLRDEEGEPVARDVHHDDLVVVVVFSSRYVCAGLVRVRVVVLGGEDADDLAEVGLRACASVVVS